MSVCWFVYRYDEVCQYNFNVHRYQSGLGHFTQIIWKASTELGIGKYTGRSGRRTCTYIVARYKDAGNVNSPRYFRRNISKGSFRESYCNTIADKSVGGDKYIDAPEGSTDQWGGFFSRVRHVIDIECSCYDSALCKRLFEQLELQKSKLCWLMVRSAINQCCLYLLINSKEKSIKRRYDSLSCVAGLEKNS